MGSVGDALLVLGLKTIIQTIAGIALQKMFPRIPSLDRFWDSAARTAQLSAWLTTQLPKGHGVRADDAYTFGLFRDCGIPVLMIPFPEYIDTLRRANEEMVLPFTTVEEESLSISHTTIGAMLAKDWRLADAIVAAIQHHHNLAYLECQQLPAAIGYDMRIIAIAQLAEHLIQRVTGLNQTLEWSKLGKACLTLLGATEDDLVLLEEHAKETVFAET